MPFAARIALSVVGAGALVVLAYYFPAIVGHGDHRTTEAACEAARDVQAKSWDDPKGDWHRALEEFARVTPEHSEEARLYAEFWLATNKERWLAEQEYAGTEFMDTVRAPVESWVESNCPEVEYFPFWTSDDMES